MPRNAFDQRASALEDEFFYRVDQQLILKLHREHELKDDQAALTAATGIEDQAILDELTGVQITPKTLMAFSLFPSIHVAWSNGRVETPERDAVLKGAENTGVSPNTPAYELLQSWLQRKPSAELFKAWKDFIRASRPVMSAAAFGEMHKASIQRTQEIAAAAGGFLGFNKVSPEEKAAIAELEAVFVEAESLPPAASAD